jgi:NadR type nicotinamide-nucleotide adenylyltransferase
VKEHATPPTTPDATLRVVITGPECTGKTTLAQTLAAHFKAPWLPEFVRAYYDGKGRQLDVTDVEPIARGQMREEDLVLSSEPPLLVKDTDLLSTVIYSWHYYGRCPEWIAEEARERAGDLYLLCDVDVPWVPDGQRDRPRQREEMYQLFRGKLEMAGARVVPIHGGWKQRDTVAMTAVRQLLSSGSARADAAARASSDASRE